MQGRPGRHPGLELKHPEPHDTVSGGVSQRRGSAGGGLENGPRGCNYHRMSDALQIILADPELRQWPHHGPAATSQNTAEELASAPFTPLRPPAPEPTAAAPIHPTLEITAPLTTALTAPAYRGVTATDNTDVNATAHPAWPGRTPAAAADRDDTYYPPVDNSAASAPQTIDEDDDDGAQNSPHTTLAFDEIARRANPIADKFGDATEWLKNNWRRPRTAIFAAAAVLAAVSLTAWATTTSAPMQPTATVTDTSAQPNTAAPQSTPGADSALPVKSAEARCPAPSTDPMLAFSPAAGQPWKCVQAWGVDGQVLTVTLPGLAQISAVAIMPGANSEAAGEDQWGHYRTVERLTWTFNDDAHTEISQCTNSRRDLVVQSLAEPDCVGFTPRGPVIASQVQVTIEKTIAPPSANALGPVGPVDSSSESSAFAVSRLQIIGHPR